MHGNPARHARRLGQSLVAGGLIVALGAGLGGPPGAAAAGTAAPALARAALAAPASATPVPVAVTPTPGAGVMSVPLAPEPPPAPPAVSVPGSADIVPAVPAAPIPRPADLAPALPIAPWPGATDLAPSIPLAPLLSLPAPADLAPALPIAPDPALLGASDAAPDFWAGTPSLLAPVRNVLLGVVGDDGKRHPPPPRPPPPPPPPAVPWQHIAVRPGDNLSSLAARAGTTVDALATVNGVIARDRLQVGQVLYIPPRGWKAPWHASGTDSTPWPISLPAMPTPTTSYTVRPGDTLLGIAGRFGLTLDALIAANRLASQDYIVAGQVLTIPGRAPYPAWSLPPQDATVLRTYTVQPGDSLSLIASRFGLSPNVLASSNGLSNQNWIQAGQIIHIPDAGGGGSPEGAFASVAPFVPVPAQPAQYTVRPGDALSVIAARYGTTTDALVRTNNLASANQIQAGQVIKVPGAGGADPATLAAGAERPVTSPPSIGPAAIDAVLARYHSPAAGTGTTFYALGVQYGIDPAYAVAFFIHESSAGTRGVAPVTHSIGNIRSSGGYADYQGYRSYSSWEAGIADWYNLIRVQYIDGWGLRTVSQIVPRYAPATENDVPAYVADVQQLVAGWAGPFGLLSPTAAGLRANLLPTAFHVTSEFGHYPWGGPHYGVDVDAPLGTALAAPVGGVVVEVETHCVVGNAACGSGWGNHVWWRSAVTGHFILVAHFTTLNPLLVPGVAIQAGTLLGFSGTTGYSTGPHVHVQANANAPTNAGSFDPSLELPWEACGHPNPTLGQAWGSSIGCN